MSKKRVLENHQGETDPEPKRQKLELSIGTVSDRNSEMIFNTELIDLNGDCQEAIFQHLDLVDLLNIAESHVNFLKAAGYMYSRLYKDKTIRINGKRCAMGVFFKTHTIKTDYIEVNDHHLCSQLLSIFGGHIKNLSINFNNTAPIERFFNDGVQAQINEFCSSSLVELTIENCQHFSSEAFMRPFREVRYLSMQNCKLPFDTDEFYRIFPCLTRLELLKNTAVNPSFIEQHIPGLEHLALEVNYKGFTQKNILTALCFNQQLSRLYLMSHVNTELLHSINELIPNLQHLQLVILFGQFTGDKLINFKHVQKVKLTTDCDPFIDIPMKFDQLKELDIVANGGYEDGFINFIIRNKHLTKLSITAPSWNEIELSDSDVTTLGQELNLTELTFQRCYITDNVAIDLMNDCKVLRKLQFDLMEPSEELNLNIKHNDWNVINVSGTVQCERR
ncbi:uncharacterized protein LOC129579544 [Sitodiplosis mosellana]|uniref:uncharacterized protein LOC129579544 n=1 Tax=Sitodiplosis mosellana TaxID=263140 RepID=UPI002443A818|nr:uncharacterized protein LOC129579544 [Sitodiplosis mosellana]XP_055325662.1 uncharacterized protein LOC129579544 [Sitodiplosis mosellana]XP_055325663.1 uncharacterized protein LOC129579544 [Sitodiplosis mosellana]